MLRVSNHGGGCCGKKHVYSFNDEPRGFQNGRRILSQLITTIRDVANSRYSLEVNLSDRQTQQMPELLRGMARLGFVYVERWIGQHGTSVHCFQRAKQRLALADAHFFERWQGEYRGMVAGPGLHGDLPAFNEPEQPNNNQRRGNDFQHGDRVRVNSPRSVRHGNVYNFVRLVWGGEYGDRRYCVLRDGRWGPTFRIIQNNCERVEPEEREDNNEQELTFYTHENRDVPPPPPVAPEVRPVLTEYFAVFRDTGNLSRPFESREALREVYPRVIEVRERIVLSDGAIVTNNERRNRNG